MNVACDKAEFSIPRKYSVEQVDPASYAGWNELVMSHADGSFFHSVEWMRALRATYKFAPAYLVMRRGGEIAAVIPFMEVKGLTGRRKGVSLPFTDFCQPLLWPPVDVQTVWSGIVEHARARSWETIELRGGSAVTGEQSSISYFGHILRLSANDKELFQRLEAPVRRAVRKAGRAELDVELSNESEAMVDYFNLHCLTRRRHGLPPQPFSFFQNILDEVIRKGRGIIVTAKKRGAPIAGAIYFHFGGKGVFKFGASDKRYQGLRGNDLVMWEAIRWLASQGCNALHFGRTDRGSEGLRRFKLGWGTEEFDINYARYDMRKSSFVSLADRAAGWHTAFFRVIPVWLSRAIGTMIYGRFA
jgi:hypothetical protein